MTPTENHAESMLLCSETPSCTVVHRNITYVKDVYKYKYITNHREKSFSHVPLFPMPKTHQLQFHNLWLRLTILATSYRSAEAPSRQKCRKSALESAGPKRGADESAEKVLHPSSLCIAYTEARRPEHFFSTFLGTPFGAVTFQSTFSALLSGRGFGTSVAGRQDGIA